MSRRSILETQIEMLRGSIKTFDRLRNEAESYSSENINPSKRAGRFLLWEILALVLIALLYLILNMLRRFQLPDPTKFFLILCNFALIAYACSLIVWKARKSRAPVKVPQFTDTRDALYIRQLEIDPEGAMAETKKREDNEAKTAASSYRRSFSHETSFYKQAVEDRFNELVGITQPLSSSATPSAWRDFRTGEQLYNDRGKVVNEKGEEVPPSMWD